MWPHPVTIHLKRVAALAVFACAAPASAQTADSGVAALLTAASQPPNHVPTHISFTLEDCVLTEVIRNKGFCPSPEQDRDRVIVTRIHLYEVKRLDIKQVQGNQLVQFELDTGTLPPRLTWIERLQLDREAGIARVIERRRQALDQAGFKSVKTIANCGNPPKIQRAKGTLSLILTQAISDLSPLVDKVRSCRENKGKALSFREKQLD